MFYWQSPELDGEDLSTRPTILLIHGLASNARMWQGVAEILTTKGFLVCAPDLRGHGRSSKPDIGYDFPTISVDIDYVLRYLVENSSPSWERPVIAGQSWGGNVTLDFCATRPWSASGLVLVDGGIIQLGDRFPEWEACASALAPPVIEGMTPQDLEDRFRQTHPSWPESGIQGMLGNFYVTAQGTVAPALSFEHHMNILRNLWAHRPADLYSKIRVPALIVCARSSNSAGNTSDKDSQVALAKMCLIKSDVEWLDSDHDIHAQHPDVLSEMILVRYQNGFFLET